MPLSGDARMNINSNGAVMAVAASNSGVLYATGLYDQINHSINWKTTGTAIQLTPVGNAPDLDLNDFNEFVIVSECRGLPVFSTGYLDPYNYLDSQKF